jgi:mannan endo-1,4-beta-mannosidase
MLIVCSQYNPLPLNLQVAKDFAVNFMRESSRWSADIGKPIFLEEFGMARNNWENKDKEYPYLSSATTTNKDEYFKVSCPATPHSPCIDPA